ncbi:SpoIID/LytB domain-containing protein [Paenibacillus sp. YN15]|uniref:SpoIID/LytB domain-containing protein n=1 Tax=Paenibacillus sp. YN15 TaxID=1742774 RepID=UPI0015EC87A6|nr:SpoIID/LytB domain-containing protein [Paenibacillus sp. YN15]
MMKPVIGLAAAAFLAFSATLPAFLAPATPVKAATEAAAGAETIRVALMLEAGKLKSAAASVTISSPEGLTAALRSAAGTVPLPADALSANTVRAAGDQFRLKLLETADFTQAKTLQDQVASAVQPVFLLTETRNGKPSYQVVAGDYATKAAAASALAALKLQPALALMSSSPQVQGPFRLVAGSYASQAEADKARAAFANKGFETAVALTAKTGAAAAYEVWLGAETDNEALAALKLNVLKSQPAVQLATADTSKPYAAVRQDATSSENGAANASLLLFPVQNVKLDVTPKKGEFAVAEKFNRTYRGKAEISYHNNKLAVINELTLEEYLYSVVSGEMGKGWPAEALKAQAVAARSYAKASGIKYEIAHVSDTNLDQVYDGNEDADSIAAVNATAGEVLKDKNGPILALFSANAGGMTSDGSDVWGNTVSYLSVGPSPDDGAEKAKALWRRGVLPDGQVAYIHSDYLENTGTKNSAGLPVYQITDNAVNARKEPYVDNAKNPAVAKLNQGDKVTVFDEARESNSYSWFRGPYDSGELLALMNKTLSEPITGPLTSLEVTQRGASGRVTELSVNGKPVAVSTPDAYRSVLGGVPSTRFEIERSGGYTIQGAGGAVSSAANGTALYALTASGQAQPVNASSYFALNGDGKVSYTAGGAATAMYTIKGTGNGHGLGLSQWGARGWAEKGYDYKQILAYYYDGVTLTKE